MIVLGLTGSIGMGKSTTASMFAEFGVPVHDADAAVHRIQNGEGLAAIRAAFPHVVRDGRVDRNKLGQAVFGQPDQLRKLESILHPLVRADSNAFVERHRIARTPVVLLDIPLLFETGGRDRVDKVVVVSAPADIQRQRVLKRQGMTEAKFEAILARQTPDADKRSQADYIVDTGRGLEAARAQVAAIIDDVQNGVPASRDD